MRRDTAAPVFWGSAFCDTFRHVVLAGLCLSILWVILSYLVRFLLGSWPCVSRWENRGQNQKSDAKIHKNDPWERLGEVLKTGMLQDPPMAAASLRNEGHFGWRYWVPLGATWRKIATQRCQNGDPNQSKIGPKIDAKIDAEKVLKHVVKFI